jgi:hypothetical protein
MYCRECGERMRWASAVIAPNQRDYVVQVYECVPCDVVELDNPAPPPPLEEFVETALAEGSGRRSRLVYATFSRAARG